MKKSVDQLAIFENRLRNDGVWCDTSVKQKLRHKFICKNPKANTAISLCGQIIATFDKLHENTLSQKCLMCALFDDGGKERIAKLTARLIVIQQKHETMPEIRTNPTDKKTGA